MSKKVDILFNDFQQNGSQNLQNILEYQEANKKVLENINNLKQYIPLEYRNLLNEYDDSIIVLQGIMLKEYYKQGFKDGNIKQD